MSSSSGGREASRAAGGQVIVVHDAMEFSLAARSTEPTHIVLADHISFMAEFSDVPANAQAAIDVQVAGYIQSIRGNCTTPPSLNALGASDSVDLIPGQCMVVVGSLANYKFSSDLWIDGIYFQHTHQNQPRPLGGGMYIPKNAWITSCTLDWSSQGDDGCPDCPEWLDGGIFVDGGLYVKDSILANFKGVDLIETNREAFTTIEDSRVIRSTISEAVLSGVHGINGKGSTVYIERCSFEETSGPSLISTRWWHRGHDPVFFCDTELPMYNYDREKRAVSETFSRSLSELPDERKSAVLISEHPTFLAMKQNLPKIDRGAGAFQNGTPATTVLQGDSLIINRAGAPAPQSTSVGEIMGFIAAGIAFLILLSAIILVFMRGRARRKKSVTTQEKVADAGESERSHEVQSWGTGGISSGQQTQTNSRKPSLDVFDLVAASRTNSTTDFQIRAKPESGAHASTVQASSLMAVCGCFTQCSTTQEMSADGSERKPWGSSSLLQVSSSQERSSLSCNGSNRHLFRSSLRAKLGQGTDTTSSTVGTSSSQRVSDGAAYSRCATWAPEDVQVTRMPTGGCQMTCQTSCLTTMGPTNTLTKQLCTSSSPGTKLQLQLEWINANRGGHLFDFLKLIPHLGKKTGGQGVVLFAEHSNSPLRQYAIKFFLSKGSFDIERGAVCNPALRVAMPPVAKIESDPDALLRPVEGLPEPLNQWPLPPMIVTEKGESLDSFAARSAPDFFTSLQVMMHIARKLEGLHEAGWVHRDLKPGNAIWLPSSNSWTLIDFGSAARIGEKADMAFTVKYAAPETIQGFRSGEESCTADPAVDVWAFGMICFELLTYQKFYGVGTTADEVMRWLTSGELLPSEKELDPHISGCLGTEAFRVSILGMLNRDPASRPTVSQLINTWNQIFPQPAQQPSSGASAPAFHADTHSQREQTLEISQG